VSIAKQLLDDVEQPHGCSIPTQMRVKTLLRAICALALLLLAPAAHADVVTVRSGDLRAQVETDPWSLEFIDTDGREVVGENPAMPIGYRTSTGWAGASRAVSTMRDGPDLVAEVETEIATPAGPVPAGHMRIRIGPGTPGAYATTSSAYAVSFAGRATTCPRLSWMSPEAFGPGVG